MNQLLNIYSNSIIAAEIVICAMEHEEKIAALTEDEPSVAMGIQDVIRRLGSLMESAKICVSHGVGHAIRVSVHVRRALRADTRIPPSERIAILLAALLHDADDRKFFMAHEGLDNARRIVRQTFPDLEDRVATIIGYVATSKNGDSIPPEAIERPWVLWPRYADRLEASGWVGVVRCWEYTQSSKRFLYTSDTRRARTMDELSIVASKERFSAYRGESASMIDHYYDKLLHICPFDSGNAYLDRQSRLRAARPMAVCLVFGEKGTVSEFVLDYARSQVELEYAAE